MRRPSLRYMLSLSLLAAGIAALSCSSALSPVAPIVTADACQKLTTCGECISNMACGWCGSACMAATSEDARDTAPKTCSAAWVWQIGTCPETTDNATPAANPAEPAPENPAP